MLAPGLAPTRQGRSSDILNTGNNAHQNPTHGTDGVFTPSSRSLDGTIYGSLGDFADVSANLSGGFRTWMQFHPKPGPEEEQLTKAFTVTSK